MRYPVLLHGFTGSSEQWQGQIVDGLASAGYPPVLVDLAGHGRNAGDSDPHQFSLEAALALLAAAGAWPADLVGYSMGGRIALHYAAAFPGRVDRLVLESASPGLRTEAERAERRRSDGALALALESDGIQAFVDSWEGLPLFASQARLPEAVRDRQRRARLRNDPASLAAALRGLGAGALPSLWDGLPGIRTPTLLIVGALDEKFVHVAERMASAMPAAEVSVVADAGHAVHLERPDAWLAAVTAFLGAG